MGKRKLLIIGSGPAGYSAALRGVHNGFACTIIEKGEIGGTCLNRGCVPAKNWIASAEAFDHLKLINSVSKETVSFDFDISKVSLKAQKSVAQFRKSLQKLLTARGVEIISGGGLFISPTQIKVIPENGEGKIITFDNAVIATGSRPVSFFDLPADKMLDSDSIFGLKSLPESMIIVGGGYIGSEMAGALSRFGVKITVVEVEKRLLPMEDEDISATLAREFKKQKISVLTSQKIVSVSVVNDMVEATLDNGKTLRAKKLFQSAGRKFNADSLDIEKAGILIGNRGEIATNKSFMTTTENIYAVGDVAGKNMLAYTGYKEGSFVADIIAGKKPVLPKVLPTVVFTIPEIGSVGLREWAADSEVKTSMFHMRSLARANATGEIAGFVKVIADKETDRLLGVHIMGKGATDMIHIASLAIEKNMTASELGNIYFAHPTFAEGIGEAGMMAGGFSFHG